MDDGASKWFHAIVVMGSALTACGGVVAAGAGEGRDAGTGSSDATTDPPPPVDVGPSTLDAGITFDAGGGPEGGCNAFLDASACEAGPSPDGGYDCTSACVAYCCPSLVCECMACLQECKLCVGVYACIR